MNLIEFINTKPKEPTFYAIKYNNYNFKAHADNRYKMSHQIWNNGKTVYYWENELNVSVEKLERAMQYAIDGVECCCQCLEPTNNEGHRFFAGIYCKNCWTPQMQEERDWAYAHLD